MIIHNPIISGSIQFPADADGNKVTLQVNSGVLETIQVDSSNNPTAVKPSSNLSGSFTGSFTGDGSNLTGIAASSFNIDLLSAETIAGDDNILFSDTSDSGNEKKGTFVGGLNSLNVFSGSSQVSLGSASGTIDISAQTNFAVGDTAQIDLILTDDTLTAHIKGGVISGSAQLLNVATDFGTGRVSGDDFGNVVGDSTFTGSFVGDGTSLSGVTSYTDSDNTDHLNSLSVISGSSQVNADSITNFDSNVKTKLDAETVISGSSQVSITSSQISDVDAFSQSGNYSGLRAQSTTATDVGLGNVDNESKATMFSSAALTGNPTAPTQADNDNSTKIATTAYVQREVSDLLGGAPAAFDTLLEISASIANGDSDVVALTTTVGTKLAKASNLSDLSNAGTARANLGVDAAGTDNSTDVTLTGNDYLTISGQAITAGAINNDDLTHSSITIDGSAIALGGSVTTTNTQLSTEAVQDIVGAMFSGNNETRISATYQDTDGTIDLVVTDMTANDNTQNTTTLSFVDSINDIILRNTTGGAGSGTDDLKIVAGSNITLTHTDADNITISSTDTNTVYSHPSYDGDDLSVDTGELSGATVISDLDFNVNTDALGHVTDATLTTLTTRELTASDLGLGNVTNESKSTMFASPTFTGVPISTTPSADDNSTKIATTAYVQGELTALIGTAPSTLDTLGEISASIANGDSDVVALTTTVGTKLAKSSNLSDLADAGTARANLGVDAAGTDNSTDVTLGNTNYLSISGQAITGGTVPIGSGGTGATSAGAARTALGVDAAGTDNSTDVTLVTTSHDYLSISGQAITLGAITNDDLTASSITINGTAISLGGTVTTPNDNTQLSTADVRGKISATGNAQYDSSTGVITSTDTNTQLSNEQVQDIVGGMLGGTETGITVTYQDTTGDIDFVVASQTANDFTNDLKNKLDGIDTSADVNLTAAQTRTLVGTGNAGVIPTIGTDGHFLKHDGTFGLPSYTTNTDTQLSTADVRGKFSGTGIDTSTGIITNTTYTAGNGGLVPSAGAAGTFLRHDGTFGTPSYTTNTNLSTEAVQDIVGAMFSGNAETRISATYQDADGTIDLVVTDMTANDNDDVSVANLKTRLAGGFADNAVQIGDSDDTVTIPGNLTVTGTTTTNNVTTVSTSNGVVFEGTTADGHDATLLSVVAGADVTYTLPNKTGTVAMTSDITGTNSNTNTGDETKARINALDITEVGTISSGTWNGSAIASAYLDSDTAHLSGTQTFTGAKTFSANVATTNITSGTVIVTGGVGISGALNVGGDIVAYASSDERLKDNIELISNPIEKVQSLKGVTWDWNSNADELQQSLPNVGVIAQDVEKVLPQLVIDRDNGFKGVDYAKLTGLLIEAVKDQQKQIDELKSKLS